MYLVATLGLLVFSFAFSRLFRKDTAGGFAVLNEYPLDTFDRKAKREWQENAETLIKTGVKKGLGAFKVITDMGTKLLMEDHYAEEIRNDDRFGVYEALKDVTLFDLPGFESMFQGSLHNHAPIPATHALNRELAQLTTPLSEEASQCLEERWTNEPDWHPVLIHETALGLLAQMTTRALIGPELCRNPEWLAIASDFTMNRAAAIAAIQSWPWVLHSVVHWFLPVCWDVRRQIQRARSIILPVLKRHKGKAGSQAESRPANPFSALAFIDRYANGSRYDATMAQLRLTGVSIHTTSDMLEKVFRRICTHRELIQPLREEVIASLVSGRLQHGSLLKLPLMESVMKEAQRLDPPSLISMFRVAKETITLKDGTTIPKGTNIAFANNSRFDDSVYQNPEVFDAYRFYRMRDDPKLSGLVPFTKTTASHLAFGHGKHACPGRFLACNETKVILAHMLLKYDFKWADDQVPEVRKFGIFVQPDPTAVVMVRRRQEDVPL